MCDCLDDSEICEICGVIVVYREFPGAGRVLTHLVDHGVQEDGVSRSIWERHTRESCLDARQRHWTLLVGGGLSRFV